MGHYRSTPFWREFRLDDELWPTLRWQSNHAKPDATILKDTKLQGHHVTRLVLKSQLCIHRALRLYRLITLCSQCSWKFLYTPCRPCREAGQWLSWVLSSWSQSVQNSAWRSNFEETGDDTFSRLETRQVLLHEVLTTKAGSITTASFLPSKAKLPHSKDCLLSTVVSTPRSMSCSEPHIVPCSLRFSSDFSTEGALFGPNTILRYESQRHPSIL